MLELTTVVCPYCFEAVEFTLERDVSGQFVQDCEVCCRPWRVHAWWDEDGRLHVTVDRDG